MTKIIDWIKKNWLITGLVLLVIFPYVKGFLSGGGISPMYSQNSFVGFDSGMNVGVSKMASLNSIMPPYNRVAPVAQAERMVIQDTSLSVLVKDVHIAIKGVEKEAVAVGGYMVDRNVSQPEGAASGYISVRVPVEKREEAVEAIKALGVKTVSENVNGTDVTDQYVDLEARLASLVRTKAKIEEIMGRAERVSDLMEIQMQLSNIEQQIDSVKGQQLYLSQTAKLTLISVNLSTDELALPYTPDASWRPGVVFKEAVRSMIGSLRGLGNAVIWLVAYLPILVVIVVVIWIVRKWLKNRK